MADPSFAEQWQTALTLAEVRGWNVWHESGRYLRVTVGPEVHTYVYPYDAAGLAALIHHLAQYDPKPMSHTKYKTHARFAFGFTDPRDIYGTHT